MNFRHVKKMNSFLYILKQLDMLSPHSVLVLDIDHENHEILQEIIVYQLWILLVNYEDIWSYAYSIFFGVFISYLRNHQCLSFLKWYFLNAISYCKWIILGFCYLITFRGCWFFYYYVDVVEQDIR